MRRAFYFSVAAAAVIGFATSGWAQTGGAGGASGSAGAGASGSVGAGASGTAAAGTSGTGAAGTADTVGAAGAAGTAGVPGATNGVGASNGLGANNGVNTRNNAVNTGATSRSAFGNTGGIRSNLNSNAGFNAFNGGISPNPFFNNAAVRQQLNLNDSQFNTLNRAYQEAYTNYKNGVNGLGNNLTPDQRYQQMELLQNQFNDRFNRTLDSTLSDSRYRNRYDQLNRQYMGLSNFNNPAIQKQLNLTPQQLNQIRQLSTSMRSQESNLNPNGNQAQFYSQYWDQLNSILTPQQQQAWSQLTGERFDFGVANTNGAARGTTGAGFPGTGGTANGNANGTRSPDPNNNLTAPRSGNIVPFGTAPSTNGTGTNPGATSGSNGNTTGGTGSTGTSGSTSGAGTAAGGNSGTTTGANSSSK